MAAPARKFPLLCATFAAAALLSGAAQATDNAKIAQFAENMVNNVLAEDNTYNATTVVDYPGYKWAVTPVSKYKNSSTCAPFVSRTVMAAFDWTTTDLRNRTGSTSPSSLKWHEQITTNSTYFTRVTKPGDIQRGDIIAIKYICGEDVTGHTMIALGAAVARAATPPLKLNTVQYELRIADSTSYPHTPKDGNAASYTDVRKSATGKGAGIGTVRIYADRETGDIVGYAWSMDDNSAYYDNASCRVMAIGRFK